MCATSCARAACGSSSFSKPTPTCAASATSASSRCPPARSTSAGTCRPSRIPWSRPTVELLARPDLHPALSDMLIEAAQQVHGRASMFQNAGEFPAPLEHEYRISEDAARYYKSGKTFVYRHLPFWLASLVDRILVIIVPLAVLLIPAMKLAPWLYRWRISQRIYRRYGELMALERAAFGAHDAGGARRPPAPARRDREARHHAAAARLLRRPGLPAAPAHRLRARAPRLGPVNRRALRGVESPWTCANGGCRSFFSRWRAAPRGSSTSPTGCSTTRRRAHGLTYEQVVFPSRDGTRLVGWFIPAAGYADPPQRQGHGGAFPRQRAEPVGALALRRMAAAAAASIFSCSTTAATGPPEGRPEPKGVFEDSSSALDYVRAATGVDPQRLLVLGQSLGGANAIAAVGAGNRAGVKAVADRSRPSSRIRRSRAKS